MTSKFGFTAKSFEFLEGLSANNEREWFNANKATFKGKLEAPFLELLETLSERLSDALYPLSGGKATMFRMNRDVRFSDDKRPYKTSVSGLLTPSGTKNETGGLVYIELNPSGGLAAAGYYKLSPKELSPIRTAMIKRADEFDGVLADLKAAGRSLDFEDQLSAMPKGFTDHSEHRHAGFVRLKSLIIRQDLPKTAWLSDDGAHRIEAFARDAMPLFAFMTPLTQSAP